MQTVLKKSIEFLLLAPAGLFASHFVGELLHDVGGGSSLVQEYDRGTTLYRPYAWVRVLVIAMLATLFPEGISKLWPVALSFALSGLTDDVATLASIERTIATDTFGFLLWISSLLILLGRLWRRFSS